MLAIEVLSPSTKLYDLNSKKAAYERLGVPNHWVVGPVEPRLTAFELAGDGADRNLAKARTFLARARPAASV